MKPSERRALREAEEAARREEKLRLEDEMDSAAREIRRAENGDKPIKRKEGFFQSHVRIITFVIATIVVLILGPLGIDMLIASEKQVNKVTNLEDITLQEVYAVHDNAAIIKWEYFEDFNYEDHSRTVDGEKYLAREYPIAGTSLVLRVEGFEDKPYPEIIRLIDYTSGKHVNVLTDDPRDFVRAEE